MPFKWVSNAAETVSGPIAAIAHSTSSNLMTGISDFVQQSHNFIASW